MSAGRNIETRVSRAAAAAALAVLALSASAVATPVPATSGPASAPVVRVDAVQAGEPPAPPDAAAALRMARKAQRAFEHVRRRNFPRGPLVNPKCGESIGRFCLVEGWDDDDWDPVPEVPEVVEERLDLIAVLDSAARIVPMDAWLTGQRVAYRLEAGRADEALGLLEACDPEDAWCEALAGFVLQESGRYAEAEVAFGRALGRMSAEERCEWTELGPVLDRRSRGRYERFACGSSPRRAVERSFWHLSDPLWLVPGLERRSEHFARRVRARLQADAASPWGLPWGDDLTEITLRFGWPAGWERARRRIVGVRTDDVVWSHRPPGAQRYTVSRLGTAGGGPLWNLDEADRRTSWAPAFGEILRLPHQVASFRRDGRRRVVAAFAWPDSLLRCELESGIFLADAHGVTAARTGRGDGPLEVAEARAVTPATLVGVEARCETERAAARARMPLADGHPLLSDILLLHAGGAAPSTLAGALARARRDRTARGGETLALYWEWYGSRGPAAALEVTLSLAREGKGFWRRALEWSGLASGDADQAGIRWLEMATNPGSEGRTVELRLPMLDEGRYRLTLEVVSPAHGHAESSTEIEIVAAPRAAAVPHTGPVAASPRPH
ncbi:tetratricopeptide repeat protein [Candidatus Palauibacter sp.]|uniref:tetratricopeptide repeat protein n=1 Tax=Candidatus Palauibacter sp. TaxID=3101350 RepID=UPI003B01A2C9